VDGHLRRAVGEFDARQLRRGAPALVDREAGQRGGRVAQRIDGAQVLAARGVAGVERVR